MGTCYFTSFTTKDIDLINSALEKYYYYCKEDSENEHMLEPISDLEEKIANIRGDREKALESSSTKKVQIICGDAQVIENRINEMLLEWQMDGPLIASGNMFYQKMVRV